MSEDVPAVSRVNPPGEPSVAEGDVERLRTPKVGIDDASEGARAVRAPVEKGH